MSVTQQDIQTLSMLIAQDELTAQQRQLIQQNLRFFGQPINIDQFQNQLVRNGVRPTQAQLQFVATGLRWDGRQFTVSQLQSLIDQIDGRQQAWNGRQQASNGWNGSQQAWNGRQQASNGWNGSQQAWNGRQQASNGWNGSQQAWNGRQQASNGWAWEWRY